MTTDSKRGLTVGTWYDIVPPLPVSIPGTSITTVLRRAKCVLDFPGREGSFVMQGAPLSDGRVPSFVQRCFDDDPTKPRVMLSPSAQQDE